MSEVDDFLNSYESKGPAQPGQQPASQVDELMKSAPAQDKSAIDQTRDIGLSLLKSAIAVPETVVGLADIPTGAVEVACLEYELGSVASPDVQWIGHVSEPPRFTDVELELNCTPGSVKARAADQGPRVQRACFKEVYSTGIRGCNLVRADFETTATLTAVDGVLLTAAAFDGQPLTLLGGGAEWTDANGAVHGRMITYHSGTQIRIHFGGPDLAIGTAVTVYPNCEQTWEACAARRADPQNHIGSAQYLPVENPTAGGVSMTWR